MNRLRRFLFIAIVAISSSTLALGGEMQFPGKTEPPPPPASASATESAAPESAAEGQSAWQDLATAVLRELLLSIY